MPTAIWTLISITVFGFFIELILGGPAFGLFALWPLGAGYFMPWQVISYAFLHAGLGHLGFNMFGLWMFGRDLEELLGRGAFFRLYFASVLSAGLTQLLVTTLLGSVDPTVGASGGVFGILLAYAIFFPKRIVVLLIPPIPLPAWLFVSLYALVELTLGAANTRSGVAHFAHLGGMVGSYLVIHGWRLSRRRG